jgi:hypothetical protein
MKLKLNIALLALAALLTPAVAQEIGRVMQPADAALVADTFLAQSSRVNMYIWSDKYVYQAGEPLTLRWTVQNNGDLYPYTIVAFRQNNQNGRRFFLPGGGEAPTDITGRTLAQGFQPVQLANASKAVLVGNGGAVVNTPATIPNELGMHTLTVQLRDYTGTRVLKAAYMKIGVVSEFVNVTAPVTANTTWVNTRAYRLNGVVRVNNNAALTIQPGTFVIGQPGTQPPSALLIERTGRLFARGTRARPIVMTSALPFGQRTRSDWGGLLMLGAAPTNNTTPFIEGLPAEPANQYGGTDPTHNCGAIEYVRIEYAGVIFSPNNETNSFTWGSCGSQTVGHHLQAHFGGDDSFEWFGGSNDLKYLVSSYGADDNFDYDFGWTGRLQYAVAIHDNTGGRGNRGIEADNNNANNSATPWTDPTLYNVTLIGNGLTGFDENTGDANPAVYLRRGVRSQLNNILATNFGGLGFFVTGAVTLAEMNAGRMGLNGLLLWNNGRNTNAANTIAGQTNNADVATFVTSRGAVVADPMLRRPFDYSNPDFRPMPGSPALTVQWTSAPDDGFFDQNANFAGAFGEEDWTEEWTNFLRDDDIRP